MRGGYAAREMVAGFVPVTLPNKGVRHVERLWNRADPGGTAIPARHLIDPFEARKVRDR